MPTTERMTLRRMNWPDVDNIVALNADLEVMRHHDDGHPMTAARVLAEEMPRLMAYNRRADQLGCWVAHERAEGGFLGWFIVAPVDGDAATVELSYRLRQSAWNQGYETEGALHMIDIARTAGVTRLVATTSAEQPGAPAVMETIGLELVPAGPGSTDSPLPGRHREVSYAMSLDGAVLPTR